MGKKGIIVLAVLAGLLAVAIAVALSVLYAPSGTDGDRPEPVADTRYDALLGAVPEDAAAVLCFSSVERTSRLLRDDTKLYGDLLFDSRSDGLLRLVDTLAESGGRVRKAGTVVSLHFRGNLVPLLLMELSGKVDSSRFAPLADSLAIAYAVAPRNGGSSLLFSPSPALVSSALRHVLDGSSILDDKPFRHCLSALDGDDLILCSNEYASQIMGNILLKRHREHAAFLRGAADWTGFAITDNSDAVAVLDGHMRDSGAADSYARFLAGCRASSSSLSSLLPSSTFFALSMPMADAGAFVGGKSEYLDATGRLTRHNRSVAALKAVTGLGIEEWVALNDIREVATVSWISSEGSNLSAVLLRCGSLSRKDFSEGPEPYGFASYAAEAFGTVFGLGDESWCVRLGGWVASGSQEAVSDLLARRAAGDKLDRPFPEGDCTVAAMLALDLCDVDGIFRPAFAKAVSRTLAGARTETACLRVDAKGMRLEVSRTPRGKSGMSARAFAVEVPAGPFAVTNCATGKKNAFYQNGQLSLCLRDENGKDVWGIPFKDSICGRVAEIDYYANGKIQFLFAASSRLYLVDRLGRFVKGFPVELDGQVLLGPDAYDFTGAHGYTVMVLHADNRLERYDLHGVKPSGWSGIRPESPVTGLPELLTIANVRYWLVPTLSGDELYPFAGGERVKDKKTLNQIKK